MDIINAKFRKVREDDLERLMNWRMHPDITRYLNTDPKLTMEGQKKWYAGIKEEQEKSLEEGRKSFNWILEVDGVPSGYISLSNIDYTAKKIHTGAFVAEKSKRSFRLAVDLQWNLYRYSFDTLGMNKVCEEVFAENRAVNGILDICGSTREGLLRNHVCKHGIYYDVVVRGILKSEWDKKKETLKYNRIEIEE